MRVTIVLVLLTAVLVVLAGAPAVAQDAPDAAAEAAPAARPAPKDTRVSALQIVKWGGGIGYFIIFLSVVTLMLIALHLLALRRAKLCPLPVQEKLATLFKENKLDEAVEYVDKENSLLSRVLSGGLSRRSRGYAEMEEVMDDVAEDEAMRLEQNVGYFSLIAAISPLFGLLGTVYGMIIAFNEIRLTPVVTPEVLAAPIEKALVTTCFGLVVAIPNVVAFTVFRNRLHRLLADLALVVEELTLPFQNLKPSAPAADPKPEAGGAAK